MKKLPITKEAFEKSKYFTNKYGKLEYVSESGKLFKTDKGKIMKFKESVSDEPASNGDYARRLGDAMSVVKEIGESGLLSSAWDRQIQKLYDNIEGLKKLVERKTI